MVKRRPYRNTFIKPSLHCVPRSQVRRPSGPVPGAGGGESRFLHLLLDLSPLHLTPGSEGAEVTRPATGSHARQDGLRACSRWERQVGGE
ncbi:hypothetical protein E2C01_056304 [Portunus trituberculatus]|uniref:Uncharacterized protein n=1 Tax=Portunus trituberculatus TaxID=210409 RepID=A0A5B7GQ00_PORTR|nr:hypothetical protein [Portunus trituberculatus]